MFHLVFRGGTQRHRIVGDEILTAGGILGKVTGVSEHYAVVKISDSTEIKIQKASVSMVVPKGTFDEA